MNLVQVRGDKHDAVSHFLERPSRPSGTCVASAAFALGGSSEAGQHAGARRSGRDGVDADLGFGDFERHRLGDAFDGVLGADIDRGASRALVSIGRRDIDDVAGPGPAWRAPRASCSGPRRERWSRTSQQSFPRSDP